MRSGIDLRRPRTFASIPLLLAVVAIGLGCGTIRSSVPHKSEIPAGAPLAIDGVWVLEENQKRYRSEGGRWWIMDPLVVGPVRWDPGQVTGVGVKQTGPREFKGRDLGTPGYPDLTITMSESGLVAQVRGALGVIDYHFTAIELDDPAWYQAQLESDSMVVGFGGAGGGSALVSPNAPSALPGTAGPIASALPDSQRVKNPAAFGRYHALVIGNDGYRSLPKLQTAIRDAEAVSALLRERYAFDVKLLKNATREQILVALRGMRETLTAEDNLLVYYAGHGWLDRDADEGYWLPVDAEENSDVHWISNAAITGYLRSIRAKHILIVADSCYSGALTRGIKLDVRAPDYLETMASKRARVVLSSGGLEPVADGGGGGHSAFARSFLDELHQNEGAIDTTTLYARIRRPIMLAADQSPELADIRKAGHEGGDFLFIRNEGSR